ncbi:MAG: hypothetical protein ACI9T8_000661 [Candidatus Saccharimonadales bacterium]|jgi:hypothetical protein
MNKVIAGIVILLITGSGIFIVFGEDSEQMTASNGSISSTDAAEASATNDSEATQEMTEVAQMEAGSEDSEQSESAEPSNSLGYVDYSDSALEESKGTKRIVFFHANWCSTCVYFEGQIEEEGVPSDITVLKANYDKDTDLKKKYGVTIQSTFVLLDEQGNVAETWPFASGLRSIQDLYDAV